MKVSAASLLISIAVTVSTGCGGSGDGPVDLSGGLGLFPSTPVSLTVDAGPDQSITEGDAAVLQGNITASDNCYADFAWRQIQGPDVELLYFAQGDMTATVRTPYPLEGAPLTLTFEFKATCNDRTTEVDTASILVQRASAAALCSDLTLAGTLYVWLNSGCTPVSDEIQGDVRVATIYGLGEAEPNDSYGEANPFVFPARIATERIGANINAFVSGLAGTTSDFQDYYIFTPPETGTYEVILCNAPLLCTRGTVSDNWVLELRDQDFGGFASTVRNQVTELKLRVHLEAGLPYYLLVDVFNGSTSEWGYNLTILSVNN